MQASMERVEAMMMHMVQSLRAQPFQQPAQQHQHILQGERRSSYVNGGAQQRRKRSLQGLISTSSRRNEATSGHQMAASQQTGVNLMTLRSQRICVDPRASVVHSYIPESQRNRASSEVICAGKNNPGRSTSGNVFNRLGRDADMRETLNMRREQEHSQHSIT